VDWYPFGRRPVSPHSQYGYSDTVVKETSCVPDGDEIMVMQSAGCK